MYIYSFITPSSLNYSKPLSLTLYAPKRPSLLQAHITTDM